MAAIQRKPLVERIDFHRSKYGREILVDAAWVREMPTMLDHGPHYITFYEILLVTQGTGAVWLDGFRYQVGPRRLIFTAPGQIRNWQVERMDGLGLLFPALFLDEFFHDPNFLQRLPFFSRAERNAELELSVAQTQTLKRLLLAMREELRKWRPDSVHLLRARLYEALVTVARYYAVANGRLEYRTPNPLVSRFAEQVERHAARRHRVADYARELAVSAGHLNALCRRYLGLGAKAVIAERLVVEARRMLLYTDESAERIGASLGFKDPSYFTRFFRRMTGRSPAAFRSEARE